jgi:hypothetical protein
LDFSTSRPSSGDRTAGIAKELRLPGSGGSREWPPPRPFDLAWFTPFPPPTLGTPPDPCPAEARDLLVDGFDAREDVNQLIPELGIGFGQLRRQRIALALKRCCPAGWVLSWLGHSLAPAGLSLDTRRGKIKDTAAG